MLNYNIVFVLGGERKTKTYLAPDVGSAFAKCLKANPGCELISGHLFRRFPGGVNMWMDYKSPSTAQVIPLTAEPRVQDELELNDPRRVR